MQTQRLHRSVPPSPPRLAECTQQQLQIFGTSLQRQQLQREGMAWIGLQLKEGVLS